MACDSCTEYKNYFLRAAVIKCHQMDGLRQQTLIPLQFWRLKVSRIWNMILAGMENSGASPSLPVSSFWLLVIYGFLGCRHITPVSACHAQYSVCLCLRLLGVKGHWSLGLGPTLIQYGLILINYICRDPNFILFIYFQYSYLEIT